MWSRAAALLMGVLWAPAARALDITEMTSGGLCKGILLNGDIARDEARGFIARMVAAAERCGTRNIIVVKMPGGSVGDAMEIGLAIRSREYITAMLSDSTCASACGLVYLGGVERYWRDGARFIIHRPEIHSAAAIADRIETERAHEALKVWLARYVSDMGGNPDYVDAMYAVRAGGIKTLDQRSMNAFNLFTTIGAPF